MFSKSITKPIWFVFFLMVLGLMFNSCEESTTDPGSGTPELQLSEESKTASQVSWQLMQVNNTHGQLFDMVSGNASPAGDNLGMINRISQVRKQEQKLKLIYDDVHSSSGFGKVTSDSLIWFKEWTDPIFGTAGRRALYYNDSTQIARFYETIYQFPPRVKLEYDSTEIRAFVGPSLSDSTDDQLKTISKLSLFEQGFFVERMESNVEATDYDEFNNVTGAIANNTVWYGSQTRLRKLIQDAEMNPDQSGFINERLEYRDDTFLERNITFFSNYEGEFSETWRTGTTVDGTFDRLEDDNHAAVTRNVNYANNPFVSQLEQSADYTLDPSDSSSISILTQKVHFQSGRLDTSQVEVNRFLDQGHWVEEFAIQTSNHGQSNFTVTYFDTYKEFEGEHTSPAPEAYYARFNGVEYVDGSGELWLRVYESEQAYLNGEPPILTAHIRFNGDGTGDGEITESNQNYQISYSENGEIEVSDDEGNSTTLSGY